MDAAAFGCERRGQGGLLSVSPKASCRRAALLVRLANISMATCTMSSNPVAVSERAYGKTVWSWPSLLRSSLCGSGIRVNRRGVRDFREGEGGQNELGSRESTA